MDDTLLEILIAGVVVVGIALGIGIAVIGPYITHYRYRRELLAKAEGEIERRSYITKLDDLENKIGTPTSLRDYKTEWNKEHKDDYSVSLEKQKLYEDELKNLQQPSLKDAVDSVSKAVKK